MNVSSNKPSDADREFLQAELTRLVGQGRLDLDTYQEVVDIVWSTDSNNDLMQIRARFLAIPPQHPNNRGAQGYSGPPSPPNHSGFQGQQGQQGPQSPHMPPPQSPMHRPSFLPNQQPNQQQNHYPPEAFQQHPPQGIPMGGHLPQYVSNQVPPSQPEQSTMGSIKKTGHWVVPAYSSYKLKGADLHLDLRKATASAPVITFDVNMNMGSMVLIVPPGVFVDVQMESKNWSDFKVDSSAPLPGAPRVIVTGISRASTLKVITKHPNEPYGFWEQMFGN